MESIDACFTLITFSTTEKPDELNAPTYEYPEDAFVILDSKGCRKTSCHDSHLFLPGEKAIFLNLKIESH